MRHLSENFVDNVVVHCFRSLHHLDNEELGRFIHVLLALAECEVSQAVLAERIRLTRVSCERHARHN